MIADLLYLPSVQWFVHHWRAPELSLCLGAPYVRQRLYNRCDIKGPNKRQALSIPVEHKGKFALKEATIAKGEDWQSDHWRSLQTAYARAPFWEDYSVLLEPFYEKEAPNFLVDFTMPLMEVLADSLAFPPLLRADYDCTDYCQNDRADLIKANESPQFLPNGREVRYEQLFGNAFVHNLSVLDVLLNEGPEASLLLSK